MRKIYLINLFFIDEWSVWGTECGERAKSREQREGQGEDREGTERGRERTGRRWGGQRY